MKSLKSGIALAAVLLAGASSAEPLYVDWPVDLTVSTSNLTRAEVLADFHLWRISGMEEQYRGEAPPNTNTQAFRVAQARYTALRQSPQFAELVQQLDGRPFASVAGKR